MEFVILGSGGAMPVPRPFCQCRVCKKARKGIGVRNHCSAFLTEANFLFDAGEDISLTGILFKPETLLPIIGLAVLSVIPIALKRFSKRAAHLDEKSS